MKRADHTTHIMKKISTTVEEVVVKDFRLRPKQKRLVTKFVCVCSEEDVYYRPSDHPEMMMEEYTKPAKK